MNLTVALVGIKPPSSFTSSLGFLSLYYEISKYNSRSWKWNRISRRFRQVELSPQYWSSISNIIVEEWKYWDKSFVDFARFFFFGVHHCANLEMIGVFYDSVAPHVHILTLISRRFYVYPVPEPLLREQYWVILSKFLLRWLFLFLLNLARRCI